MINRSPSLTSKVGNLFVFTQDPYIRRQKARILLLTLGLSMGVCLFVVANTLVTKWQETRESQKNLPVSQVFPVHL